jgi:pimeloyl-ACP methyl ester carboxylesterase
VTFLDVNGVSLHVAEITTGGPGGGPDGPTAVLVHGLAGDSMASWYLTLAYPLAERGMRVLLHDLRGHGRSGVPGHGYALDDFVDDLEGLLAGWGVTGAVHLFGNSFGGTIAFGYALRHPGRVAAITAIDSAPPTAAWFARVAGRLGRASSAPAAGRPPAFARRLRHVRRLLTETTLEAELPASRVPDPAAFKPLTCPVLSLYGGDSWARDLAGQTERLLPQTRTVVLEGAGHTVLVDRSAEVRGHITAWLDDMTTSPVGGREGRTHHG